MPEKKNSPETPWLCPHCGEQISRVALLCPACREPLTGEGRKGPVQERALPPDRQPRIKRPVSGSERSLRAIVAQSNQEHVEEEIQEAGGDQAAETDPSAEGDFHPDVTRKRIQETLDQLLHKSLTAPATTPAERRLIIKSWMAIIVVALGAVLLIRLVIVRPWAPRAAKTPQAVALARKDPAAGLGIVPAKTASGTSQTSAAPAAQNAEALEAAADQLQRMARFLASGADSSAPPPNPAHYESLLPPLAPEEIPGPNATREQVDRFEILQYQRQSLGESLAANLQGARTAGLTREQAVAAANQLLREAHALRKKLADESGAAAPASPPPSTGDSPPPTEREVRTTVRQLLGTDIEKKLQAIRQ